MLNCLRRSFRGRPTQATFKRAFLFSGRYNIFPEKHIEPSAVLRREFHENLFGYDVSAQYRRVE